MNQALDKERIKHMKDFHRTQGDLNFLLELFGEHLAEQKGWKMIGGMDAIHLYLVNKHHWLPCDVKSMNAKDLELALHEEMQGWTAPAAARGV